MGCKYILSGFLLCQKSIYHYFLGVGVRGRSAGRRGCPFEQEKRMREGWGCINIADTGVY